MMTRKIVIIENKNPKWWTSKRDFWIPHPKNLPIPNFKMK